jgi:cytochrome P450/glycosyltransferase involved in cell wall biosynthesis
MDPLFTVVIPTLNYGRFLRRAIDSVLDQSASDTEVVVVDDGSTDDTPVITSAYGSRITSLRQENRGVFAACRAGVFASSGRFLVFLDADDALTPGSLAVLREAVTRSPTPGLVVGRHVNVTASGLRPSGRLMIEGSREAAFGRFLLGHLDICTGAAAIVRESVLRLDHHDGSLRVGMEASAVAHALWHHDAVAVDDVLLEVHEHTGRLRDNIDEVSRAGDRLVDAIFDPRVLPEEAFRWREPFRARLLRDRARSFHRAGRHRDAVVHFERAWQADPLRTAADLRNLRRYVASRMKIGAKEPAWPVQCVRRRDGVVELGGGELLRGHLGFLDSDPIGFIGRCHAIGDVVRIKLWGPTYLLTNPADIAQVFAGTGATVRRTGLQIGFPQVFGSGLFTRTGRSHIEFRRPVQSILHRGRLDVFANPIRAAAAESLSAWGLGTEVDVSQSMQEFTFRVAMRLILGISDTATAAGIFDDIQGCHQRVVRNRSMPVPIPSWLPTRRNRMFAAHASRLHATVVKLIDHHRQVPSHDSVLARLVHFRDAEGHGYSDVEIRDHVMLIFLACYEPTATALSWLLDLLARHPDQQLWVREEIDELSADDGADEVSPQQRSRTAAVINEGLRLHPSVWMMMRRTTRTESLPSGAVVPAGVDVAVSIHHVHRDPRWYEDPAAFKPTRFLAGTAAGRAANTFLPFGLGPSVCLGEYLARLLLAIAVEQVLARYEFEPGKGPSPQPTSTNGFTSQPDGPVRLVFHPRA